LIPFVLVIALAEWVSRMGWVAPYLLPPPSEVLQSFVSDFAEYFEACKQTLSAALLGLVFAAVGGVLLALLFSVSEWIEDALYPYATFFQTVPIVSIAPLLVIWFGFGLRTVIISAFIVSIFPIIANTLAGLRATSPELIDLFRLYGASRRDLLFKLKLPSSVPHIVTGLKISSGLAMIGAVIGEFIAGGGLGGVIDEARTQQRLDKVFAAVLLASFAGLFLVFLINSMTKLFLNRWRELK
jgi:NitT/TauT family transport system permease protein